MPENEQPLDQDRTDPPRTDEEIAYEEGIMTGRLFLQLQPRHEEHSDVPTVIAFAVAAAYAMITKGIIPVPTSQEDGNAKMPLVNAFINGMIFAYSISHGQVPGGPAPPPETTPAGKPTHDPMFR